MMVESREAKNVIAESKMVFLGGIYVYVYSRTFWHNSKILW